MAAIRNPVEWSIEQLRLATQHTASIVQSLAGRDLDTADPLPAINVIDATDIQDALAKGIDDARAFRTDVLALAAIYPLIGLLLWWMASNYALLPLLFPLISGFALVGPIAAIGIYEMSRQRELGHHVTWANAFDFVRSPSFSSIIALGVVLALIFAAWLAAAHAIYLAYLGPGKPASVAAFIHDVVATRPGRSMALVGIAVGFLFAVVVLSISVVSFPMLLDRRVGIATAVVTSLRAIAVNPRAMAIWGAIIAGSLALGALPFFIGLIVVVPVLGHATWHLYRKLVAS